MTQPSSAQFYLDLAKSHLERAQTASFDPVDWTDLTTYGFYCLEAAVVAAATYKRLPVKRTHPEKVRVARDLARSDGLPDITDLLSDLNTARKATAYGDVQLPALDAEDLATRIEEYVNAVESFLEE